MEPALHARDIRVDAEEELERHRALEHGHAVAVESATAMLARGAEQCGQQRNLDDLGDPQRRP